MRLRYMIFSCLFAIVMTGDYPQAATVAKKTPTKTLKKNEASGQTIKVVTESQTEIEKFLSQCGTVLLKGYGRIGEVATSKNKIFVKAVSYASWGKVPNYAVEIDLVPLTNEKVETKTAYLDYRNDDIASLTKGLELINECIKSGHTPGTKIIKDFECIYKTKGALEIVASINQDDNLARVSAKIGRTTPQTFELTGEELLRFRDLIEKAREQLDAWSGKGLQKMSEIEPGGRAMEVPAAAEPPRLDTPDAAIQVPAK